MTNHVHLLLTPRRAEAVPRLIMSLGRRYVQYIENKGASLEYFSNDALWKK
jgi:putative transposase